MHFRTSWNNHGSGVHHVFGIWISRSSEIGYTICFHDDPGECTFFDSKARPTLKPANGSLRRAINIGPPMPESPVMTHFTPMAVLDYDCQVESNKSLEDLGDLDYMRLFN